MPAKGWLALLRETGHVLAKIEKAPGLLPPSRPVGTWPEGAGEAGAAAPPPLVLRGVARDFWDGRVVLETRAQLALAEEALRRNTGLFERGVLPEGEFRDSGLQVGREHQWFRDAGRGMLVSRAEHERRPHRTAGGVARRQPGCT